MNNDRDLFVLLNDLLSDRPPRDLVELEQRTITKIVANAPKGTTHWSSPYGITAYYRRVKTFQKNKTDGGWQTLYHWYSWNELTKGWVHNAHVDSTHFAELPPTTVN